MASRWSARRPWSLPSRRMRSTGVSMFGILIGGSTTGQPVRGELLMSGKMKNSLSVCALVVSGFVFVPRVAEAHHGWAEFDSTSSVMFQGIVTDFHFTNPHCVVDFDAKDE